MSDPRLISPMLDGFALGDSVSSHSGVTCYPAMRTDSDERYIVKTISIPASQVQLEALLLTGAYPDEEAAKGYFQELVKDVRDEVEILDKLSSLRGFIPYTKYQIVPMEEGVGYDVFLLSPYKQTLERQMKSKPLTHLAAVNMGIDLCAALSVCREAGFLYVDLKPGNIFLTGKQEYLIGDIGFLQLNSLKYASLPDRYRSGYVPPEIADAYATLNTSMDTYALGLVLYQVYNNGQLPFDSEESRKALMEQLAAGEVLPPPAYADYEMAAIILKACAFDPQSRWSSPNEMGHALIAYMQRNAVNDVPIVPPPIDLSAEEPMPDEPEPSDEGQPDEQEASSEDVSEGPDDSAEESDVTDPDAAEADDEQTDESLPDEPEQFDEPEQQDEEAEETDAEDQPSEEDASELEQSESDGAEDAETEQEGDWIDRMGTILSEDESTSEQPADPDEPTLRELLETDEESAEELSEEQLTGEAAQILSQAQELIEHETPEPAVAPEPIDVPIPAPIVLDDDDEDNADAPGAEEELVIPPEEETVEETLDTAVPSKPKWNIKKIVTGTVAAIVLAALLYGGYYVYTNIYLIPVKAFTVKGRDDILTVTVETDRDEDQITVVCKDNFGNVERIPVENGQATFNALTPGSQYLVTLEVGHNHRLTGQISQQTYSTPTRTQVVSLSATAGPEDGSAVVNFAVEGPDSKNWTLHYVTEGEEEKTHSFSGHTTTVTGLTLGKSYTFRLSADDDVFLIGENSIPFFSGELVFAENIGAFNTDDGALNVNWTVPEGASAESWTVHCFNENGYDQTLEVTDTKAVFADTSATEAYTVEITAKGMSESKVITVTANPVTITKLKATGSGSSIDVKWEYEGTAPANGWVVTYSSGSTKEQKTVAADETSTTISPVAPGIHYEISIQTVDQTSVFGKTASVDTEAVTTEFSGYRLNASDISVSAYHGPDKEGWGRGDLGESTTTFAPKSKMALLYYTGNIYNLSSDELVTMFIIRDADGNLASMTNHTRTWNDMWDNGYCVEEIAELPSEAGSYTLEIYINGAKLSALNFTVE